MVSNSQYLGLPEELRETITAGALALFPSFVDRFTLCTCGGQDRGHTDSCEMVAAGEEFAEILYGLDSVDLRRAAYAGELVRELQGCKTETESKQYTTLLASAIFNGADVTPSHRPWLCDHPEIPLIKGILADIINPIHEAIDAATGAGLPNTPTEGGE